MKLSDLKSYFLIISLQWLVIKAEDNSGISYIFFGLLYEDLRIFMICRLDKDICEVTPSERERTKRVVYAVMYGAGREKLAEVLQISPLEAKEIITSFISKLNQHFFPLWMYKNF